MSNHLIEIQDFVQTEVFPLEQKQLSYPELATQLDLLREKVKSEGWWLPQLGSDVGGMGLTLK